MQSSRLHYYAPSRLPLSLSSISWCSGAVASRESSEIGTNVCIFSVSPPAPYGDVWISANIVELNCSREGTPSPAVYPVFFKITWNTAYFVWTLFGHNTKPNRLQRSPIITNSNHIGFIRLIFLWHRSYAS